MATYNTVPDDETSSLQNKPETKSLKYIVAGAAAASFLIGVALATATTAGVAAQQQTSFKTEYAPDFFNIELASDHSKCLAANGKGDALTVIDCKKHEGHPTATRTSTTTAAAAAASAATSGASIRASASASASACSAATTTRTRTVVVAADSAATPGARNRISARGRGNASRRPGHMQRRTPRPSKSGSPRATIRSERLTALDSRSSPHPRDAAPYDRERE